MKNKIILMILTMTISSSVFGQSSVVVSDPSSNSTDFLSHKDTSNTVFSMTPIARPLAPEVRAYDSQDVPLVPILNEPTPLGSDFHKTFLSVKRILRADFNATTSQYVEVFYPVYWYENDLRLSVSKQTELYELEMELQVVLSEYRTLRNRMVGVLEGFYNLYQDGKPEKVLRDEVIRGLTIHETLITYAPAEGINGIVIERLSPSESNGMGNQIPTIQIDRLTGDIK